MSKREQFLTEASNHLAQIDEINARFAQFVTSIQSCLSNTQPRQQKLAEIRGIEGHIKQAKREANVEIRNLRASYNVAIDEIKNLEGNREAKSRMKKILEETYTQISGVYGELKTNLDGLLVQTADLKREISTASESILASISHPIVDKFLEEMDRHVILIQEMFERYKRAEFEQEISSKEQAERALVQLQRRETLANQINQKIEVALSRLQNVYQTTIQTIREQNFSETTIEQHVTEIYTQTEREYEEIKGLFDGLLEQVANAIQQVKTDWLAPD